MFRRLASRVAFLFCLAMAPSFLAGPAQAQQVDRIAAVVNDEIISMQDLNARVRLAMVLSNLPDSAELGRRIVPQVLRKMIDERLQVQEAARLKITVSPAEIEQGLANVEAQNRMPRGALLKQLTDAGVDPNAVREQLKADLLWMKVMSRVLQPTIRIGEEEIAERLDMLKNRAGRPEYLIAEILLPVESATLEDDQRRLGERLLDQLRAGAQFGALARQFSQSPTAGNGGSTGWVAEDALDPDLADTVKALSPGQYSGLVRTSAGFQIVALLDRRIAGSAAGNPNDALLTLSQITLPTPKNGPPKQELIARARTLTQPAQSCEALEALGRKVAAPQAGSLGTLRLGDLPADLRRAVAQLPENRASEPVETADGLVVAMVCRREQAPASVAVPSREAVRRQMEDERLDMMGRRYIRDLRRAAFVEIRA